MGRIVVLGATLALALNAPSTAKAAERCIVLGTHDGGARGYVVARPQAELVRALERGTADGTGDVKVRVSRAPCTTTLWVDPRGTRLHTLAVVGPGWSGTVHSPSTRIDGLVAAADVASTVLGGDDVRPGGHANLGRLRDRLQEARDARVPARIVVFLILLGLALVAPRRALVAGPAAVAAALLLAALGSTSILLFAALTLLGSLLPMRAVWLFFAAWLVVLVTRPELEAYAVLGTHADGAGRFYGMTNELETLVLAPALLLGLLAAPLVIATVAWSRAGADGGGALVFLAGYAVLALGLSPRRLAVAAAAAVAGGLALVGVDAATGGSSHVTRTVGDGPWAIVHSFTHRWSASWQGATANVWRVALVLGALTLLVWVATRSPRVRVLDAFLVAITVSLLVNDTPQDVLLWGSLQALALRRAV